MDNKEGRTFLPKDSAKSNQDEEKRASRWRTLTLILIAINLACLIVLLIVAVIWTIQYGQPNLVNTKQMYCINCSKVNKSREYKVIGNDVTGDECCGSADMMLKDMVQTKLSKNLNEEESRDPFHYSRMQCGTDNLRKRPATRLVGLLSRSESNSNEFRWGKNSNLTFLHKDINYRDGKLVPTLRGTYYLYSQITVNLNRTSTSLISHMVYRRRSRDNEMEQLLEGAISNCQLSVNSSDSTSYLGATFMLEANDEIAVKITHPGAVKYDSSAGNYFGMHKI